MTRKAMKINSDLFSEKGKRYRDVRWSGGGREKGERVRLTDCGDGLEDIERARDMDTPLF